MDFGNLLPPDSYFSDNRKFTCNGSFSFNRFGRMDSARESKPPLMEYAFSVDVKTIFSRQETGADSEPTPSIRSGVFRELPKDRKDPEASSLSHDTASVASLNVGAELSASDVGSCGSASLQEDDHDSDETPADLRKTQSRRRKFTRLTTGGVLPVQESEDEQGLGKKFSSLVVREALPSEGRIEEASAILEVPPDVEVESQIDESEFAALSNTARTRHENLESSGKVINETTKGKEEKRKSSSMERPSSQKREPKIWPQQSKESLRDRSASTGRALPKRKAPLQETDFMDDLTSLERFERLEEQFKKDVEFELLTDIRIRPRKIGGAIEPMESKHRKPTAEDLYCENTEYVDSHLNIIYEEHSRESIPKKIVRRKVVKKVSKQELSELQAGSGMDRPTRTRNGSAIKKKVDECGDFESAQPKKIASSREKPGNASQAAPDMPGSEIDTSDLKDGDVPSSRNKKSKLDLSLRARWVEVNKVQAQVLDETEKFLEETCQAELNEVHYEDQLALGLANPPKATKKLVKARKPKVVHGSELDSSYLEEDSPSSQVDLLPKKKRTVAVEQEHVQLDFRSSEEYISISEVTLTSAESIVERENVTKKKPRSYAPPENDMEINLGKPLKKKVVKRKSSTSSTVAGCESNVDPEMELPQLVKKKVVRKKSQRLVEEPLEEEVVPTRKVSSKKLARKGSQIEPLEEEEVPSKRVSSKKVVGKKSQEEPLEEEVVPTKRVSSRKLVRKESHEEPLEEEVIPIKKASSKKLVRKECREAPLEEEVVATRRVSSKILIKKESQVEPLEEEVASTKKVSSKKLGGRLSQEPLEDEVFVTRRVSSKKSMRKESEDSDVELTNDTVVQKLKSWRSQQIKQFEEELACREQHYKSQLEEMECKEAMISKLGMPEEASSTAPPGADYEAKFNELEQHISKLKAEMEQQVRLFECRSQELRQENVQLAIEKSELKARIATMEQQIGKLRTQGTDEGDLKQVLGELRSQNSRFTDLTREKERYKKQWRRCAKKVHALKLTMYERSVDRARDRMNIG